MGMGQFMGDHPSHKRSASIDQRAFEQHGTCWFSDQGESQRNKHLRTRFILTDVEMRILDQIRTNILRQD